jgi:hypothetical protein
MSKIGGDLTVNGNIAATNLSGTNTGDQTITISGDVQGAGTGAITATIPSNTITTGKIADSNVTYQKIQNEAATSLLGNPTASPAAPSEVTLDSTLSFIGTKLAVTPPTKNFTTTTVTGTSEQDMHTYTFAANTFATNGDTYYWNGGMTTIGTASTATNTFRLYVNGTAVMTVSFTNQGNTTAGSGAWSLTLQRKDATTLTVIPTFLGQRAAGTNFQWGTAATQTVTLSSSFIIKVTGQCGQSAGTMSALSSILTKA